MPRSFFRPGPVHRLVRLGYPESHTHLQVVPQPEEAKDGRPHATPPGYAFPGTPIPGTPEIYSLAAFIPHRNKIRVRQRHFGKKELLKVKMRNHGGFTKPDPRPDTQNRA